MKLRSNIYSDYVRQEPQALPEWRWTRARELVSEPIWGRGWIDDASTIAAVAFLNQQLMDPSTLSASPIAQAYEIYEKHEEPRWKLEAFTLAQSTVEEIAARLQLPLAVVSTYESLFFDTRALKRASLKYLFGAWPALGFGDADLGRIWRWIGHYRGPDALNLVIAATSGEGRENYSPEALDSAALFVETSRIRIDLEPWKIVQLDLRSRVE